MIDSNQPDKEVLLVTNNRIIYLIKSCDIFSDNIKVNVYCGAGLTLDPSFTASTDYLKNMYLTATGGMAVHVE